MLYIKYYLDKSCISKEMERIVKKAMIMATTLVIAALISVSSVYAFGISMPKTTANSDTANVYAILWLDTPVGPGNPDTYRIAYGRLGLDFTRTTVAGTKIYGNVLYDAPSKTLPMTYGEVTGQVLSLQVSIAGGRLPTPGAILNPGAGSQRMTRWTHSFDSVTCFTPGVRLDVKRVIKGSLMSFTDAAGVNRIGASIGYHGVSAYYEENRSFGAVLNRPVTVSWWLRPGAGITVPMHHKHASSGYVLNTFQLLHGFEVTGVFERYGEKTTGLAGVTYEYKANPIVILLKGYYDGDLSGPAVAATLCF
jgi:hypothetical protein